MNSVKATLLNRRLTNFTNDYSPEFRALSRRASNLRVKLRRLSAEEIERRYYFDQRYTRLEEIMTMTNEEYVEALRLIVFGQ